MSAEENKAIIQRFFDEVWNQGHLNRVDELEHPNSINYGYLTNPEFGVGQEGTKRFVAAYRTAFPNIRVVIEDIIAEGDKVAVRWLARGTHTGQLLNFSPTGKEVITTGTFFYRLTDGKIAEVWGDWDRLGFMEQVRGDGSA
jgi:steroid delta-isomerase-like uncharacterized protein